MVAIANLWLVDAKIESMVGVIPIPSHVLFLPIHWVRYANSFSTLVFMMLSLRSIILVSFNSFFLRSTSASRFPLVLRESESLNCALFPLSINLDAGKGLKISNILDFVCNKPEVVYFLAPQEVKNKSISKNNTFFIDFS